jgi:EmrB/QacA subfamily drug resistance transporter
MTASLDAVPAAGPVPPERRGAELPVALYDDPKVHRRRWWTLAVLCLSLLIVSTGNSSLNVAIPTLFREMQATESQLQWVVAIYSLVFAGLLFTTGAIGDRFGRKGALQAGLALFLAACFAATFSTEMWQLIACRAVMGIGAAFIMPSTLSILVNVFGPAERVKAISLWASVTGGAGAIGPVASGWVIGHYPVGSVFLINVPLVVLALVGGWYLVPKSKDPEQAKLDPIGAVLSIIGVVAIVYGLIEAPGKGWSSAGTITAFGAGVVVLGLFVAWERTREEPMLDIRLFKNPAFSTGTVGMILVFMSLYGMMFLVTQYFQFILGYSPLEASVRFLPIAPVMLLVGPQTPKLSERFGVNRVVAAGLGLLTASFLMFRTLDASSSYWFTLFMLLVMITGIALAASPMTAAIMSAVPARRAGAGSAMNDATRELGAALGIAVMGSLAASQYSARLDPVVSSLPAQAQESAQSSLAGALEAASQLPAQLGAVLRDAANAGFLAGMHLAVTAGALMCAVATVLVIRYLPKQLSQMHVHGAPEPLSADEADEVKRLAAAEAIEDVVIGAG